MDFELYIICMELDWFLYNETLTNSSWKYKQTTKQLNEFKIAFIDWLVPKFYNERDFLFFSSANRVKRRRSQSSTSSI